MADAKRCDKCGKYYDKNCHDIALRGLIMNEVRLTNSHNPNIYISFDLCDECFIELDKFLKINTDA